MGLSGKLIANRMLESISNLGLSLKLIIIQVGDNPASNIYIKIKIKSLSEIGFECVHVKLMSPSREEFKKTIMHYSNLPDAHGIIVQLPLSQCLQPMIDLIPYCKDVDGITIQNQGMLFKGYQENLYIKPCTASACLKLLDGYNICTKSKRIAVFGKSFLVTKPLIALLQNRGATVISINKSDPHQAELSQQCDILISAIGAPHYIKPNFVKENAYVLDIGITKQNGAILGDVHPDVLEKTKFVSPPIGGIGPLTVSCLAKNLVKCYELQMA